MTGAEPLWDFDDEPIHEFVAALAAGDIPSGLVERAARRPRWMQQAACRGRSDVSWFSEDDVEAATEICARCPVIGPCRQARLAEKHGVWGGVLRG